MTAPSERVGLGMWSTCSCYENWNIAFEIRVDFALLKWQKFLTYATGGGILQLILQYVSWCLRVGSNHYLPLELVDLSRLHLCKMG